MFIKKESNTLPYYAAFTDIPFCTAGITTRAGGVSEGYLASLNLGIRCGDTEENLKENFGRVGKALGFAPENIVTTSQKHTSIVRRVYSEDAGVGVVRPRFPEGVDGLVTNTPDLPLFAYFADCVPVLFCDPEKKAVGVAHSGWRGTVQKIAAETVQKMETEFGSRPGDIRAAIGPHIGACCFEVDAPVYEAFYAAFPGENGFARPKGEKYHIDLSAAVAYTLREAGVEKITDMNICTVCNADTFFSHRKTKGKRGCFGAVIYIRP